MKIPSNLSIHAIYAGVSDLQELCGVTAASKGFHEDRPTAPLESASSRITDIERKLYEQRLRDWQGNKLMLIVSEAAEAQDEIRKGKEAAETYYPTEAESDYDYAEPILHKPEGVPSEIADIVIRCFDFAYTEGFSLADIIVEKLEYNASREYMHGKKF